MSEDVSKYAPPSDELLDVLGMRLIDIQNKLMLQNLLKRLLLQLVQLMKLLHKFFYK